jgi:hypothetical protein
MKSGARGLTCETRSDVSERVSFVPSLLRCSDLTRWSVVPTFHRLIRNTARRAEKKRPGPIWLFFPQKNIRRTSVLLAVVSLFVMITVPGVAWAACFACTSYHWMPACRVYCVRVPPSAGPSPHVLPILGSCEQSI